MLKNLVQSVRYCPIIFRTLGGQMHSVIELMIKTRTDKRYLAGLFQGVRSCDGITQKEWEELMNKYVRKPTNLENSTSACCPKHPSR